MIYFDTSYLVRLYFEDAGAGAVRALAATDNVSCAAHGHAEMLAAFHCKLLGGNLRMPAYSALLDQVRKHDEAGAFQWLAQGPEIFARIVDTYARLPANVFLRAADAIHLATAAEAGFKVVYSNDTHLLAAAIHFGIQGKNVIDRVN